LILFYSVKWCGKSISPKQNILLTAYSTLVNFFGPLQSGPGFRAIYLKAKNGVNLRSFIKISLAYYGFFAWYSGMFLFLGAHRWWDALAIFIAGIVFMLVVTLFSTKFKWLDSILNSDRKNIAKIALITLLQVIILSVIYFVELRSVNHTTSFGQAVSYTGAANFSLFVSLTPGAIGFREAFVLFTRRLSHLSSSTIIAASVLDRAVYFIYLGIIFVFTLSVHAKNYLDLRRSA
jgi:uncharacterized membrane protein YbhN (UPF0104 family)